MSILNLDRFTECLKLYKRHCGKTFWTKKELPKFYFANLLSRRIRLNVQSPKMVFEICERIQDKNYYYKTTDTKICGIQFLPGTGNNDFSEPVAEAEAWLFKELVDRDWSENDFAERSISFNALSGWLGTLLPDKFIPVTSNYFRHTISYLFDLELKIYLEPDYDFFVHSQKHFLLTREKLKEFNLNSLYLKEIAEYVKISYPKSVPKKKYEEHDWNWITNDFHFFIYREILNLDTNVKISAQEEPLEFRNLSHSYNDPEMPSVYVP